MGHDITVLLGPAWVLRAPDTDTGATRAERARQLLVHNYQRAWTLASLARAVGCNRTTLQQQFRRLTRTSVHKFLVRQRVSAAQRLLTGSDLKVTRIAQAVGYRSASAFARHFKMLTGSTLLAYRIRRHAARKSGNG